MCSVPYLKTSLYMSTSQIGTPEQVELWKRVGMPILKISLIVDRG